MVGVYRKIAGFSTEGLRGKAPLLKASIIPNHKTPVLLAWYPHLYCWKVGHHSGIHQSSQPPACNTLPLLYISAAIHQEVSLTLELAAWYLGSLASIT